MRFKRRKLGSRIGYYASKVNTYGVRTRLNIERAYSMKAIRKNLR